VSWDVFTGVQVKLAVLDLAILIVLLLIYYAIATDG
jgi:hypothetical protein